jgi:hypothetical protein
MNDEQYSEKIEISLVNVSRDEVAELRNYLENNSWLWKETPKQKAEIDFAELNDEELEKLYIETKNEEIFEYLDVEKLGEMYNKT